jgi:hypothetical protein
MEKIKDPKMKCVVFNCLHMVMFMSITPDETIEFFKSCGREIMVESLITYNLVCLDKIFLGLLL